MLHCGLHESLLSTNAEVVCSLIQRVLQSHAGKIVCNITARPRQFSASPERVLLLPESESHREVLSFLTEVVCGLVPSRPWLREITLLLDVVDIHLLHIGTPDAELVCLVGGWGTGSESVSDLVASGSWLWALRMLLTCRIVVETGGCRIERSAATSSLSCGEVSGLFVGHVLIETVELREPAILGE